jgi:polysaccharide biosynthesis/export protein
MALSMTFVRLGARCTRAPTISTPKNTMISTRVTIALLLSALACPSFGAEPGAAGGASTPAGVVPTPATLVSYRLQPGDVITVSVWKETDLTTEVLVRPDGGFSFPLAGEVDAVGKTVEDIRSLLADRLKRFIPNPVVTVAVKSIGGNRIFVVGKVIHAGDFAFSSPLDVMQAIALAGGTTPYAAINDIVILRRQNGQQQALHFHYSDVARGRELAQNIQLRSGDTVVVP